MTNVNSGDFLSDIQPFSEPIDATTRFIIIQGGAEYLCSPEQLAALLKSSYNVAENASGTEPVRTVISSGLTAFAPAANYVSGYVNYYVRLTTNLVITLPTIPTEKAMNDIGFVFDVRQDGVGGRTLTFNGVTDWYNVDPYNAANPVDLQVNKAANSFSVFTIRLVNGFWFANYGRAV